MFVFGLGHTFGALLSTPHVDAQAAAVLASMKDVQFNCSGTSCTWYNLYLGFGWFCSVFLFFTAVVAWHIGSLTQRDRELFLPVTWALFVSYAASTVLSYLYFFYMPIVFASVISILLAIAVTRDQFATAKPRVPVSP